LQVASRSAKIETGELDENSMSRRFALALAGTLIAGSALAQVSNDVVKLGVTNDQASIYSAAGGFGAVVATRMAVEDFGGSVLGKRIEVVFADNQNKPDIGVGIARRGDTLVHDGQRGGKTFPHDIPRQFYSLDLGRWIASPQLSTLLRLRRVFALTARDCAD